MHDDTHPAHKQALAGAFGGVCGGAAMTVLMTQVGPRVLPHDVLPDTPAPLKVVQWAQKEAGEPQALSGNPKKTASLGAHLGYSAAAGAMYGLARTALPPLRALPAPAVGVLFGLAVWAVSFECLLPALGVMKRTTEHAPKRWPAPLMGTRCSAPSPPWSHPDRQAARVAQYRPPTPAYNVRPADRRSRAARPV